MVIEADEFDRSFHHLRPFATVITATDADHLDIYGTEEAYLESFRHYTELIQPGGALIIHRNLKMQPNPQEGVTVYTYDRTEGDFHAENIRIGGGTIVFDFVSPLGNISNVELGVPVSINIDNGIAAMVLAQIAGATPGGNSPCYGYVCWCRPSIRFCLKERSSRVAFGLCTPSCRN